MASDRKGPPPPPPQPPEPAPAPAPEEFDDIAAELDPAASARVEGPAAVLDAFASPPALRLGLLGTGQGGGRIAATFWGLGYRRVGVFNTNPPDADGLDPAIARLFVDRGGSAKDMAAARRSVEGRDEEVRDFLARAWGPGVEHGRVCATLGGGTGSGTARPLADVVRACTGGPVGFVVSLPAESGKESANALEAFGSLAGGGFSPLIVVDNDRVADVYKPSMRGLFGKANDVAVKVLHRFNQLAALRGPNVITTFDRSELVKLLSAGGVATLGAMSLRGEDNDAAEVLRDRLADNVLVQANLKTAKEAACVFVGPESDFDKLPIAYFNAAFDRVSRMAPRATLHRGAYCLGGVKTLQCYVMLAGLDPPLERLALLAKRGGVTSTKSA